VDLSTEKPVQGLKGLPLLINFTGSRNGQFSYNETDWLGEGCFGKVYLGSVSTGSQKCAIKHVSKANPLLAATSLDEQAKLNDIHVRKLRQEVEILTMISHPNITQLMDSYEDFRNFYMVLELCSGGKLKEFLRNSKMCPSFLESDASYIIEATLNALQYLHGRDLIHRDVKPDNIFLHKLSPIPNNIAKLGDFGFACKCEPGRALKDEYGTPTYMAPQVVMGSYTKAADVWSCGATMFHLLSGRVPFPASTVAACKDLVRRGNFSFGDDSWHHITDYAKDLVRGLMKFDPQDRWKAEEAVNHTWIRQHAPGGSWHDLKQGKWRI
jgi:calcium-dependent protein kinase